MLGLAYVAPIGMQNIYLINSAIANKRLRAYITALIIVILDISLALACFFGVGAAMEKFKMLRLAVLCVGCIAVVYIGVQLIKSEPESKGEVDVSKPLMQVATTCFLVTWANPQALIDGSLLLGGLKATLPAEESRFFILGTCMASAAWFFGLTTVVSIFKNNFNEKVIKSINVVCGGVIVYYGLKLGYSFLQNTGIV